MLESPHPETSLCSESGRRGLEANAYLARTGSLRSWRILLLWDGTGQQDVGTWLGPPTAWHSFFLKMSICCFVFFFF